MTKIIKFDCIKKLKNSNDPIVIFSITEESEALKLACEENGIKVSAFCDNEIRKTKDPHCGLEVIYTPDLPKRFAKANFIMGHQ
jgi:hypothetical protein